MRPLTALAASEQPNGRYIYGAAGSFPNATYQNTNYWVDPVFAFTTSALPGGGSVIAAPVCQQFITPTPTTTPCPTLPAPTLNDFGIDLQGTWTCTEQSAIRTAAINVGNALSLQGAATTGVAAFREVMQGMSGTTQRQIRFSRITTSSPVCITAKTPNGTEISGNIQCGTTVVMNEYTATHEFGHIFVGRTTPSVPNVFGFLNWVERPNGPANNSPLRTASQIHVMGSRGYPLAGLNGQDWQRSDIFIDNGWGSAAQWDQQTYFGPYDFVPPPAPTPTLSPLNVPNVGPCGEGAPTTIWMPNATPFPLQQNPCTFPNWESTATDVGRVAEIEEAAADMFLNWVYFKISNGQTGFGDTRWRGGNCYPNGCPDIAEQPGQVRANWMNQTMTTLFTQFGW